MTITIIGAGPGGYETALRAARHGFEVFLISDGPVGGTCLNEGCIPTKALCRSAEIIENLKTSDIFSDSLTLSSEKSKEGAEPDSRRFFDFSCSMTVSEPGISKKLAPDLSKIMARKNAIVGQLRNGVETLLNNKSIHLIYGRASFKDGSTVRVKLHEGGEQELKSDYTIIATGSVSASLPVYGSDNEAVLTSREILSIEKIPERLCIIGAGVIGLEFASVFRSLGSEVTVIEFCKDILPHFDADLAKRLKQTLVKRGINIETSSTVTEIVSDSADNVKVNYQKKGTSCSVIADKVLMAVGRRPAYATLDLDAAGIEYSSKGIDTDSCMRTNVRNVFAIGDVRGGMMLAHVATFEGIRALNTIENEKDNIDFNIIPAAVFTYPEAAVVGMTEEQCKEADMKVKCLKSFFRSNGKAVSMGEPEGFCKMITDQDTGRILGCHMFGAHSAEIIHEVAALMQFKATLADLRSMIHAHPTLSEVIQSLE